MSKSEYVNQGDCLEKNGLSIPLTSGVSSEHVSPAGSVQPHWQPILQAICNLSVGERNKLQERIIRTRQQDGSTFNPFDAPESPRELWSLDLLPMPMAAGEWLVLEQAVIQRAELLEAILQDAYGPQNFLNQGLLPAELYWANPGYLRACHNASGQGRRFLSIYAVDLIRSPDGSFQVIRDHGNWPEGLGYALENRIVLSRVLADLYHSSQIHRLALFFKTLHQGLCAGDHRHRDPELVMLTPGPTCRTYFEHALLSRYLGYPLVESQDLTVRNGRVFLKKLAGLAPIDSILRLLADRESDPFALRRNTTTGVAGLIQAMREDSVAIYNQVGTGLLDSPLLAHFLPRICGELRHEELLLKSPATWWGGDPGQRRFLEENVDQLDLFSAMDKRVPMSPEKTLATMKLEPYGCMGQASLQPAEVPCWRQGSFKGSAMAIRLFACHTGHSFKVMPGGLVITSDTPRGLLYDFPWQQGSKDLWVISDQPVEPISLLPGLHSFAEFNRSSDLPSRVADNLLWLGRYLERAEGKIRLLRAIYRRLASESRIQAISELPFLLHLLGQQNNDVPPGKEASLKIGQLKARLQASLIDRQHPASVAATISRVEAIARLVRDRLSVDCLRTIARLEETLRTPWGDPLEVLDETLFSLNGFSGLAQESMTRGMGWRFMDMGRRIERATFHAGLIEKALPLVCQDLEPALESLLEVADSIMTYRARYRTTLQLGPVLDLLIIDESNPKSLGFQVNQLSVHLAELPRPEERRFATTEERRALEMLTAIRLLDLETVHCTDGQEDSALLEFLERFQNLLADFVQHVTAHYLSRVPTTPHYSLSFEEQA